MLQNLEFNHHTLLTMFMCLLEFCTGLWSDLDAVPVWPVKSTEGRLAKSRGCVLHIHGQGSTHTVTLTNCFAALKILQNRGGETIHGISVWSFCCLCNDSAEHLTFNPWQSSVAVRELNCRDVNAYFFLNYAILIQINGVLVSILQICIGKVNSVLLF